MHMDIIFAALEIAKLPCVDDRMKQSNVTFGEGLKQYNDEYKAICKSFNVTQKQVDTYRFDDKFLQKSGKLCNCYDCKNFASLARMHFGLERS